MINENNSKTEALEVLSLIKLEIDLLKERLDDLVCNFSESEFHHLEDNYNVGFSPFGPSPHSQGGSLQKELNLNDEVLFRDNDRRNVHGFISDIAELRRILEISFVFKFIFSGSLTGRSSTGILTI